MTKIEWTHAPGFKGETWNPMRADFGGIDAVSGKRIIGWACEKVSPGCKNCYAETLNERLGTRLPYTVQSLARVRTFLDPDALRKPLNWTKPRMVFVCSMTDLFGSWVLDHGIALVFAVMALRRRHTFQVLTKRPERMRAFLSSPGVEEDVYQSAWEMEPGGVGARTSPPTHPFDWRWPLPNVWVGTSVEDQERADQRIPELLQTPAARRFLSCEPLLAPVDLGEYLIDFWSDRPIDWVIAGGESGNGARGMDVAWARSLRAQCDGAGVAFFMKQLGLRSYDTTYGERAGDVTHSYRKITDRKGGVLEDMPEDLRVREWPR